MLLDLVRKQMGIKIIPLPTRMELEKVQMYNVGTLKELVEEVIRLPEGQAMELNAEALTSSNISTLHLQAKMQGYKFHCLRSAAKRVLYAERLTNA